MFLNVKALIVVLALAFAVFAAAKPMCLRFTAPEDFARRRTVWMALTAVSFLSPSFWLYLLVAAPLIGWAAKKDSNPLALYLLLMFVIPPMDVRIPTIGIGQLFDMNNLRLLGFVILVPAVWARIADAGKGEPLRFTAMDGILLAYGLLQMALLLPYEATTNTVRRAFLYLLDVYLVYFAFSRLLPDRYKFADALGSLCVVAAVFAPMAVFESVRGWLLYIGIGEIWAHINMDAYLMRGDSLRAQAATGHSITLGYIFAVALGCGLYLRSTQVSRLRVAGFFVLTSVGLVFTFARGPWLTAAVVVLCVIALGSRNLASAMKSLLTIVAGLGVLALTPLGAKVVENLPFIGTQSQESVTYRQQLAEVSWALIQQNPFFGNPFVMLQMEELRPGAGGIIDLVNGYAQVALFHGLVGLALFVALFAVSLVVAFATFRRSRLAGDYDMALLGSCMIACMIATLFFIATAGSAYMQWLLAGLMASYAGLHVAEWREPVMPLAAAGPSRRRRTLAT